MSSGNSPLKARIKLTLMEWPKEILVLLDVGASLEIAMVLALLLSHPLGNQTNYYAEANATVYTTKLALEVGVKHLWMEGVSNNIIRCIKGDLHPI